MLKTLFVIILLLVDISIEATPSSSFWTVCTTDVYKAGSCHIDEDNIFKVYKRRHDSSFPPDTGFETGIYSWNGLNTETGFDYLAGAKYPIYFNAAVGLEESRLFSNAPAVKFGIFNAGTRCQGDNRTNQNIVNLIVGKTLPSWIGGKLCVGGFSGSKAMGEDRQGWMISYQKSFKPMRHKNGQDYFKWVFVADYASGRNTIGGGGVGAYYYFAPNVSVLTGPVFFNSAKINGRWKWSLQIDIGFSIY